MLNRLDSEFFCPLVVPDEPFDFEAFEDCHWNVSVILNIKFDHTYDIKLLNLLNMNN